MRFVLSDGSSFMLLELSKNLLGLLLLVMFCYGVGQYGG
jgi:hypothetical protein